MAPQGPPGSITSPRPLKRGGSTPPNPTHAEANLCRHIVVARTTPRKQIRISIQVAGSGSGVRSMSALFVGLDAAQRIGAIVDSAPNPPFEVTISQRPRNLPRVASAMVTDSRGNCGSGS